MSSIYFIRCKATGLVKIGLSGNPRSRLSKMQSDSPGELEVLGIEPGGLERERALHNRFADHRIRGEWFSPTAEILAHARTLAPVVAPRKARLSMVGTDLNDDTLAAALGCVRSYTAQMRLGMKPVSLEVSLKLFGVTGDQIGPLRDASPDEIAVLSKYVFAAPYFEVDRQPQVEAA